MARRRMLSPSEPKKVLTIIHLRETEKLKWKQIGIKMGESKQGPFQLYRRWRKWAKEQQQ
jgi:hypothetical protein